MNDFPEFTWRQRVSYQAMAGPSFAAVDGDEVLAVGGIAIHHPGVGELWMVTSTKAKDKPIGLVRGILRHFEEIARYYEFVRVQVTIPDGGLDFSTRVVKLLGFERETRDEGMRRYGQDGSTCHLYARIY